MAAPNELLMHCPIPRPMAMDPRWRANIDPAPNCPRCASSNTKFCYYNNYSLSQPRYFCKGCRRYWTRGGSLRNVPLGGGCRKTRRSRSKALAASSVGGFGSGCSSNPSSNSSSESGQDSNNAPDIDMAAVFARFLSNDQSNNSSNVNEEINEVATTNTPSESSHESLTSTSVAFDQEFQITDEFVAPSKRQQIEEEETFQEFVTSDFAGFDGIVDDVFWSNELTWQPVPELEEFDSPLLPLDQSTISHDNWSGLDDMVYEAFPRH